MSKISDRTCQCLMLEADERRYFTHEEHLPQLLEFCKSFDVKMSVVKAEGPQILDLTDLPKAVCDAKKTPKTEVSIVRNILPFDPAMCVPLVRTRTQILETAKAVREKIREKFSKGEAVSLDMLEEEFPESSITDATFMQHVRNTRKELTEQGYSFERISPKCYRSITPDQQKAIQDEKKATTVINQPIFTKFHKPVPQVQVMPLTYNYHYTYEQPTPMYELGKPTVAYYAPPVKPLPIPTPPEPPPTPEPVAKHQFTNNLTKEEKDDIIKMFKEILDPNMNPELN